MRRLTVENLFVFEQLLMWFDCVAPHKNRRKKKVEIESSNLTNLQNRRCYHVAGTPYQTALWY